MLKEADDEVERIERQYRRGLISNEERYNRIISIWNETTDKVTSALMNSLDSYNPIYMMAHSGARAALTRFVS